MSTPTRPQPTRRVRPRIAYVAASMAAVFGLGGNAAFAQATGAQANSTDNTAGAAGNTSTSDNSSTTATGTTSRTDSPTGRDATRNRSRTGSSTGSSTGTSGDYVPRSGSSSHRDQNGNVIKDRSTGGSPAGRERPPNENQ